MIGHRRRNKSSRDGVAANSTSLPTDGLRVEKTKGGTMKKALVSVLRLTMFVCFLALLPYIRRGEGQVTHQCATFDTENDPCPSCCTKAGNELVNIVVDESSVTGTQSIQDTSFPCGATTTACNGVACTGTYQQAVSDNGCCIASGATCASNEPCCPGTTCTGGVCAAPSGGGGGGCGSGAEPACCVIVDGKQECVSPIIIDTSGKGFFLTSAKNGVVFNFSGHQPIQTAWTAQGADNAFLCLPDPQGKCDDGADLFGNFTPQPPSNNPNGFAALAVYDLPANGGNGDGIIDARDAIFSSLRLWIDKNHDGISQPDELFTLPSLGVNSISLNYQLSQRTDQYGNLFRYRAQVNPGDPTNTGRLAYDVFFVTAP